MKKLLLAVVLLAGAAAAASPYLMGSQIEKTARDQVDQANEQMAMLLKSNPQIKEASLKIESYEKGYMNSTAKTLMNFALHLPGETEPKQYNVPWTTDIAHGPYLGDAGFGAAKLVSRADVSGLDLPDAITNDTFLIENLVNFSGDVDNKATVAPIKYDAEGTVFDFAGAAITSNANLKNSATFSGVIDVQQLKVSSEDEPDLFTLKPFKMDLKGEGDNSLMKGNYEAVSGVIEATIGPDSSLLMQSMKVTGTYEKAKGVDLMLGDAEGVVNDITFINEALSEDPIKVPELSVSSSIKQPDGKDFDITVKYAAMLDPSLMALMQSPVDVKSAELEIGFKSFPVEAIQKYQELIQNLSTAAAGDPELAQKMQGEMFGIVQMLVKNATATHIELHAKSDDGDLNADIDAGFKPGLDLSEQELMMLMAMPEPQKILSILVGRGHIDFAKGITDKAGVTPMIQMMAADFVTLDGETFKSEMQITDGQLFINGATLPMFAPVEEEEMDADAAMEQDGEETGVEEDAAETDVEEGAAEKTE